jgi:hypothetical protein
VQDAQSIRFGNLFGRHPLTAQDAKSIRFGILFAPPHSEVVGQYGPNVVVGGLWGFDAAVW